MTTNRLFTTFMLLAFTCSFATQAQQTYAPSLFEAFAPTAAMDLSAKRVDARVTLINGHVQRLASSYEQIKEAALQYTIHLATYYLEAVDAPVQYLPPGSQRAAPDHGTGGTT